MHQKKSSTGARAAFVFVTLVIEAMGFGIVMPVLPEVIRKFVTGEAEVATTYGYFIAVFALLQFLCAPVMGRLSDKYGRRPVLLTALAGTGIDYLFMAFAPTLPLLFLGRFVSGICGASYTVVTAYLADISDDSNRAKNFGLMGAGFGLGFILGPALGGLVASQGLMYPFIAAAALNGLNFLFGVFVLPESLSPSLRCDFSFRDLNPFKSLKAILSAPSISLLVIAHIFLALAGQTHPSMWAIYTESRFGWTPAQVGMSLAAVGLFSALAQGGLTGILAQRFGERGLSLWGTLGEAVTFAGYGLATAGWMVYPILAVASVFSAAQPALQSLITREVPADRQGELQGALMSLMSLMGVINPLVMTRIFAVSSGRESWFDMPGLVYYFAALFGLVAFVAVWRWEKAHAAGAR